MLGAQVVVCELQCGAPRLPERSPEAGGEGQGVLAHGLPAGGEEPAEFRSSLIGSKAEAGEDAGS